MKTPLVLACALALVSATTTLPAASLAYDFSGAAWSGAVNPYDGSMGFAFTVSTSIEVTEVHAIYNTLGGDSALDFAASAELYLLNQPGVDNSDATLLAQATWSVGATPTSGPYMTWFSQWSQTLPTPVVLSPGNTYVVANTFPGHPAGRGPASNPGGTVSLGPEINHLGSRYAPTPTTTVPSVSDGTGFQYGGPSFSYNVIPEPATAWLALSATLALALRRRRHAA